MATVRLQTPDPFNFRNPDDWPMQDGSADSSSSEHMYAETHQV